MMDLSRSAEEMSRPRRYPARKLTFLDTPASLVRAAENYLAIFVNREK